MKTKIILLAAVFISTMAAAQKTKKCLTGVYITQADFLGNVLSHAIDKKVKGNTIDYAFPVDISLTVRLTTPDSTYIFKPGTIHGFIDCGEIFRYFEGDKLSVPSSFYKIQDTAGIIMYSSELRPGSATFYSLTLTTPIHSLTIPNLEADFKAYPAFLEKARNMLKKTDGLSTLNNSGKYLLNWEYAQHVKNKQKPK